MNAAVIGEGASIVELMGKGSPRAQVAGVKRSGIRRDRMRGRVVVRPRDVRPFIDRQRRRAERQALHRDTILASRAGLWCRRG